MSLEEADVQRVKYLFQRSSADFIQRVFLEVVIEKDNKEITKLFLNEPKFDPSDFPLGSHNLYIDKAARIGSVETFKLLLADKRIKLKGYQYDMLYRLALRNSQIEIIRVLVEGNNPLYVIREHDIYDQTSRAKNYELAYFLMNYFKDKNKIPDIICKSRKRAKFLKYLLLHTDMPREFFTKLKCLSDEDREKILKRSGEKIAPNVRRYLYEPGMYLANKAIYDVKVVSGQIIPSPCSISYESETSRLDFLELIKQKLAVLKKHEYETYDRVTRKIVKHYIIRDIPEVGQVNPILSLIDELEYIIESFLSRLVSHTLCDINDRLRKYI